MQASSVLVYAIAARSRTEQLSIAITIRSERPMSFTGTAELHPKLCKAQMRLKCAVQTHLKELRAMQTV